MNISQDERKRCSSSSKICASPMYATAWTGTCCIAAARCGPRSGPLFRTRAYGIARTARYLPYQGGIPATNPDNTRSGAAGNYNNVCTYPWVKEIEPGISS